MTLHLTSMRQQIGVICRYFHTPPLVYVYDDDNGVLANGLCSGDGVGRRFTSDGDQPSTHISPHPFCSEKSVTHSSVVGVLALRSSWPLNLDSYSTNPVLLFLFNHSRIFAHSNSRNHRHIDKQNVRSEGGRRWGKRMAKRMQNTTSKSCWFKHLHSNGSTTIRAQNAQYSHLPQQMISE